MNYQELLLSIDKMLGHSSIKEYVLKTWVYKDRCTVIDLKYKGCTFALDIQKDANDYYQIFLVDRNDNIVHLLSKSNHNKIRLKQKIKLSDLNKAILNQLERVTEIIDIEYQYDVSVIVPVYNREEIIHKCINSLNNQTISKDRFEVIFVDDKSTDNSIEVIKSLVDPDLNYTILERPIGSGNASMPRNEGIKYSTGKYLLFLDSDDYLSFSCLEKSYDLAERNNSDLVYLRMGSDDEYPRAVPLRAYKHGTVGKANVTQHHLLRSNAMCKLYRKSFLYREKIMLDPSIAVAEDRLYSITVLSKTQRISILADEYHVFITRHPGEHLTHSPSDLQVELRLYLDGFNRIFLSPHDFELKNQLYNGWMIIIIERLQQVIKSKKFNIETKYDYFHKMLTYLNFGVFHINKKYIYKEHHHLLEPLLDKNFQKFMDLSTK